MTNENLHHQAAICDLMKTPQAAEISALMTRFDAATRRIQRQTRQSRVRLLFERNQFDPEAALAAMHRATANAEATAAELPESGKRALQDFAAVKEAVEPVAEGLRRERFNLSQEINSAKAKAKALGMKRDESIKTLLDAGLERDDAEAKAKPSAAEIADLLARADEGIPARIAAIDEALSDHTALVAATEAEAA